MWIITACQSISPEVTRKSFKKCWISNVTYGTDDMLWVGRKRIGMLGVSVRKMKKLPVKMEKVTLIDLIL